MAEEIVPCKSVSGLENKKFRKNAQDEIGIRVFTGGSPVKDYDWDAHDKSVASNVVTYRFFKGGLSGTLLLTGVLTYADATLCDLVSSEWTPA